jgi:hypothetical protein
MVSQPGDLANFGAGAVVSHRAQIARTPRDCIAGGAGWLVVENGVGGSIGLSWPPPHGCQHFAGYRGGSAPYLIPTHQIELDSGPHYARTVAVAFEGRVFSCSLDFARPAETSHHFVHGKIRSNANCHHLPLNSIPRSCDLRIMPHTQFLANAGR